MTRVVAVGFVAFTAFHFSACAPTDSAGSAAATETETSGDCATVYGGQVCSWSKESNGKTVEVGMTVPIASIDGAPNDEPPAWPPAPVATLNIPAAAQAASGVYDITMYWEAHGHPPGAYLTPHFDFHFNLIPDAQRNAIDCSDLTKPAALPAAYGLPDVDLPPEMAAVTGTPTLVGLCVPQMGMHAAPQTDLESTAPFDGTMVVGYYKGQPIFVEPMISRTLLDKKASFDYPIPEIPGFTGAHPTMFHAEWDAANNAYRFIFSGFSPAD